MNTSSSGGAAVPKAAQCVPQAGDALRDDPHGGGSTQKPQAEHEKKARSEDTGCGRREPLDTDTPPDWSDDEAVPLRSWPWGDSGRPSDRGDSPGPEIERTKGESAIPRLACCRRGGVSTWFQTCTGGEYNKYKSIWQEAVQSEKPREADRGSRQRSWYRSPAEKRPTQQLLRGD